MTESHVIRTARSKHGEVTIPKPYAPHINVPRLRRLVQQATRNGKGHLIPAGELSIGVVTRAHNAKTVEELAELIKQHPQQSRQGGWTV